ncbi:hypothetical protein K505DRAFT_215289, partial [Melanomma pulvis-pyrius CBS 109.77]
PSGEEKSPETKSPPSRLPPDYQLAPTVPAPFGGTLEASLDALLDFGRTFPALQGAVTHMLEAGGTRKDWAAVFEPMLELSGGLSPEEQQTGAQTPGRYLLSHLLVLVTRHLLPNQIIENRALMQQLYFERRNTYVRLLLRYDMQLPWKREGGHHVVVSSDPPPARPETQVARVAPPARNPRYPLRCPLMPNILPTLIVAPELGYATKTLSDKMRHHVTALDGYLLLTDESIDAWGEKEFLVRLVAVVGIWQWVRESNDRLGEMEVMGWEELGEGAENAWFLD